MIKRYSLKVLEVAMNYALSLDEQFVVKLQKFEGKVIEMIIKPLQIGFFIRFDKGNIYLEEAISTIPDTVIKSTPLGLIRLSLLPLSTARSLFNGNIEVQGDIELGQNVKQLFDELDIDWEGHLARLTGDVVAGHIGHLCRQGFALKRKLTHSFQEQCADYLKEEKRLVVGTEEMEDFAKAVEQLAMDADRLRAEIDYFMSEK